MKKSILTLALAITSLLTSAQPFPNQTSQVGTLKLNYGMVAHVKSVPTSSYALTQNDMYVVSTSTVDLLTFTVPTPSLIPTGQLYYIKMTSSSSATVSVVGGANIDAASTKTVGAGKYLGLINNGTTYNVISN